MTAEIGNKAAQLISGNIYFELWALWTVDCWRFISNFWQIIFDSANWPEMALLHCHLSIAVAVAAAVVNNIVVVGLRRPDVGWGDDNRGLAAPVPADGRLDCTAAVAAPAVTAPAVAAPAVAAPAAHSVAFERRHPRDVAVIWWP